MWVSLILQPLFFLALLHAREDALAVAADGQQLQVLLAGVLSADFAVSLRAVRPLLDSA